MPTPLTVARQCLTPDSASALDDAAAAARRRGHNQTTSLHMVSSLLSLPGSCLREACTRARNAAYSSRVQFRALELSLSVALDRLPSSQNRSDDPPVSNSLMAAVKRSQANQRRQPESYTFYHQQQHLSSSTSSSSSSSPSPLPIVKVELQNLVMSILDDPLVSRVFAEAGFRSCDIKMAMLRRGSGFYLGCTSRYNHNRPLFLCDIRGGDENTYTSTRIGEIMMRDGKKRCPVLVGVRSVEALSVFLDGVERGVKGLFPDGIVCVKNDGVLRCCDDGWFEEVERKVERCKVVVSLGDLKELSGDGVGGDWLRCLVRRLGEMVEVYRGRLWVIGAAASYEVYYKVLSKFPTIEEDWGLEVLPVTSFKFSVGVGGTYPRSSLMESFVPLGGFFSMPPETKNPLSNACQYMVRCHLCNEKYEQEVAALNNGGLSASVAENYQSSLPSWLQPAKSSTQSDLSSVKGKDDGLLLSAKIMGLQKKWDNICQQHHFTQSFSKGYNHQLNHQFPRFLGFQITEDKKEKASTNGSKELSNEQGNKNFSSSLSTDVLQSTPLKELSSPDMLSKAKNLSILSKSVEIPSVSKKDDAAGVKSPTSVTSVTTNLGLGIISASQNVDAFITKCPSQSYRDMKDPKSLYKALLERVCHQEEAISAIVDTITKTTDLRRNIWINLRGPDRLAKKKLGVALAEILYGSAESLVYVDLSFQNESTQMEMLFNHHMTNKYDSKMRGTVVDYLVDKLGKNTFVVFLENLDKADLVVQNGLFQAVKTGRLTDLHGREVNISNCIFLGTTKSQHMSCGDESSNYAEEDILRAKGSSIEMLIRFDLNDDPTVENSSFSDQLLMNKRKLIDKRLEMTRKPPKASKSYLDLNLPAEGSEMIDTCSGESESDSSSENSKSWLEDFYGEIDRIVAFKPFDFDQLSEKLLKSMTVCLRNVVGSDCSIEIESNVMHQILAAAWLFGDRNVEDWIRNVISKAFSEAMGKFGLNSRSIVKFVRCEGNIASEEQFEGLLPARILIK